MAATEELNGIWEEIKKSLCSTYTESQVELWFGHLILERFERDIIYFSTDFPLKYRIVSEKYGDVLEKAFTDFFGFPIQVEFELYTKDDEGNRVLSASTCPSFELPKLGKEKEKKPAVIEASEVGSPSFPYRFEYTFDNFIVGSSNCFAHAACLAVAENPACLEVMKKNVDHMSPYNPLFIYGPSGIGKTHLLHAIVNEIKATLPEVKILYIRGDDFINQMIEHLSKKTMNEFKEKYRKCDVLLIDDIQFIAGKPSTQEEFFHTFNALYEDHKQIILTSDRPPRDIKPLEDRLITRFEWGILADIQPPEMELRVAIIKKKAEQVNIVIPEDVLEFLAENLRSNIRQIEGAIKKLSALTFLTGREVTFELAKQCTIELMGGDEPVSITVDRVFGTLTRHYGIKKEDIVSEKRLKEIATVRHIAIYLIRTLTEMSFPNIAKIFGKKNHTTILSSYQLVQKKMEKEAAYSLEVSALAKEISEKY